MAELNVNYDSLGEVSGNVKTAGEDFLGLLTTIQNYNNELSTAWQGTDATTYTDAVTRQAEEMKKLGDVIEKISGFLNKVNNKFQEAEEANRGGIRSDY